MTNLLSAIVYENMGIVSNEYFNNVNQEIQFVPQSFLALESATLLFHPWRLLSFIM